MITTTVTCDGAFGPFPCKQRVEYVTSDAAEAVRALKARGWAVIGHQQFCLSCACTRRQD